jgi:hypothetical protein
MTLLSTAIRRASGVVAVPVKGRVWELLPQCSLQAPLWWLGADADAGPRHRISTKLTFSRDDVCGGHESLCAPRPSSSPPMNAHKGLNRHRPVFLFFPDVLVMLGRRSRAIFTARSLLEAWHTIPGTF